MGSTGPANVDRGDTSLEAPLGTGYEGDSAHPQGVWLKRGPALPIFRGLKTGADKEAEVTGRRVAVVHYRD